MIQIIYCGRSLRLNKSRAFTQSALAVTRTEQIKLRYRSVECCRNVIVLNFVPSQYNKTPNACFWRKWFVVLLQYVANHTIVKL